jgi:glutaredoxin
MFVFIGGITPAKPKKWLSLKQEYCPKCHNTSRWIFEKRKNNLSLFFILVLSFKTEYLYFCPVCGYVKELDKEMFEHKVRFEAEKINA